MKNTILGSYDWTKKAMAAAQGEDIDDKMERAFMAQAYDVVLTKAGELAKDPHRIGFEIVYRNDENTRMVGMFAFRAGSELFYAPAFFMNGAVKGTDMLWRSSTGTIAPLNKEWAQYLISREEKPVSGKGVSRAVAARIPSGVDLHSISYPANYKRAYAEMMQKMETVPEEFSKTAAGELLRDFLETDGGFKAMALIEAAAQSSVKFAKNLATLPTESWTPNMGAIYATKKASLAKDAPVPRHITIHSGLDGVTGLTDGQRKELFTNGSVAVEHGEPLNHVVVLDGGEKDYQTVNAPGTYTLTMPDGTLREGVLCLFVSDGASANCAPTSENPQSYILLDPKENARTGSFTAKSAKYLGVQTDDNIAETHLHKTAKAGDRITVIDLSTKTVYFSYGRCINEVQKGKDGINTYIFSGGGSLTINPDKEGGMLPNLKYGGMLPNLKYGGDAVRFIVYEKDNQPDTLEPAEAGELVDAMIKGAAVTPFTLHRSAEGEVFLTDKSGNTTSSLLPEDAKIALAAVLDVAVDEAQAVVEMAVASGQCAFGVMKSASLGSEPIPVTFDPLSADERFSDLYGVLTSSGRKQVIPIRDTTPKPPEPKIGDGWDPRYADGLPKNMLLSSSPRDLAQVAAVHNIPHVFEHGMISGLLGDFGASSIDKYLPALEKGVDALGRLLFLFYWKPGLVQETYGVDDASSLEQQLLHSFKADGALLLKLLKKSNELKVAS